MTTILKFIHLAAIAVWSGGLIVLPFLFWQRRGIETGPELDQLHRLTRFVYVGMASPAAFIAIGSCHNGNRDFNLRNDSNWRGSGNRR